MSSHKSKALKKKMTPAETDAIKKKLVFKGKIEGGHHKKGLEELGHFSKSMAKGARGKGYEFSK